tara:strand:- start:11337 stop:11516 length:180 start_codon:yes stop_codon:yes gene_type:complete
MSRTEAELQRQVNDLQQRNDILKSKNRNLTLENDILKRNVADLQEQLADCQRSKLKKGE